ncbi:MAG: D-alanine--D-alanine ligase [Chitinophagaceae bacterium]|nr:MAG: D-alanine--D-alanine ligase [Chitinophagaceae bacterium]
MKKSRGIFHRPFFIKLFNWEYWSFNTVYLPIYPIWIFLCARARSFFFFAASNPSIQNGGFLNESKEDIYAIMPDELHPATVFFKIPVDPQHVLNAIRTANIQYPLIGKPDSGGRGRGVKTITDDAGVIAYARSAIMNFHIQEYVPYKNEVGIFYHRLPGEEKGRITGIVSKHFLSVKGDGEHTIRQLLEYDKRGIMYVDAMTRIHGAALEEVLPAGETKVVSPYGNHARGSLFLDDTHLADQQLTDSIDRICRRVRDFYYGRLDIRYRSWDELRKGEALSIIEVNGAGSEPTHMYDPKHGIFFAWKEIVRHWFILFRISRMNHKRGYRYLTLREGIDMFKEDKEHSKKLAEMPE